MGHSQREKARHHDRIVELTARQIRESGADSARVAEIMGRAGLTHGGFYKQFGSRDELIAEAAQSAIADGARVVTDALDGAEDPLSALLDAYLSSAHRDDPGAGCGIAALTADAAHGGGPIRDAYTRAVRRYAERLETVLPSTGSPEGDRRQAVAAVGTLIGALTVARGVGDPALADEVLDAARATLRTR